MCIYNIYSFRVTPSRKFLDFHGMNPVFAPLMKATSNVSMWFRKAMLLFCLFHAALDEASGIPHIYCAKSCVPGVGQSHIGIDSLQPF